MKALTNNTDNSSGNGMDKNTTKCMGFSHCSYTVQDCCFQPERVFIAVSKFIHRYAWVFHYIIYNFMFKKQIFTLQTKTLF